jgi:hypothetical protein
MKNIILMGLFLFCTTDIFAQYLLAYENIYRSSSQFDNKQNVLSDSTNLLVNNKPGMAFFIELIGKGYFSANIDFRIKNNHRFSVGIASIDYQVYDNSLGNEIEVYNFWAPSLMYYSLVGNGPSFWELGAGMSISLNQEWEYLKSPMVLHGVIGYRRQIENGFLFRAGFTPFLQLPDEFWPLIGLSFGYSW